MTPKIFYALSAAAAVSVVIAGTAYYSTRTWAPATASGEALFPALAADAGKIASVTVQQGSEVITIVRDGDEWGIGTRAGYPARTDEVREAIVGLTRMEIVEEKTRNEARYALLHLEDPAADDAQSKLLRLSDDNGEEIASVILGKIKFGVLGPGRNGTYVRKPGDAQTWLVSGSIDAPSDVHGWAQTALYDIPVEDVIQVRLAHPDNEELLLARGAGEGEGFTLANLPENAKLKQDADLASVVSSVAELELWDVRKAGEIETDAGSVGEIVTSDGLNLIVSVVASQGDEHWVEIAAEGPETIADRISKINGRTAGWVFKIKAHKAENFEKRLSELIEETDEEDGS